MSDQDNLPTSEEIDRRLRIVSEMRNLCLSLGQAGSALAAREQITSPPQTDSDANPPPPGSCPANRVAP